MNLRQGQEVRDAADPNRIGIVVGTGSSLGARVLWCFDERLTWTSERPVVPPARTPADVLTDPQPGDRVEVPETDDFEASTLTVISVTADDVEFSRSSVGRFRRKVWAEPCDEDGNAYVCIPASDVPPPTP